METSDDDLATEDTRVLAGALRMARAQVASLTQRLGEVESDVLRLQGELAEARGLLHDVAVRYGGEHVDREAAESALVAARGLLEADDLGGGCMTSRSRACWHPDAPCWRHRVRAFLDLRPEEKETDR